MAGIYVHIPFCRRRCGYCDFYSSTNLALRGAVVRRIGEELREERGFLAGAPVRTLYFGGGTPTLCEPEQLQGIVDVVKEVWGSELEEITVEANPDDLTPDYLARLAATDVNRLSIGVQSFVDRDLGLMNRRHDARAAIGAVRAAQKAGFGNITIDLIYGIPGMSLDEWRANVDTALALGVQHISAYHLTIEAGTPFARLEPVDDDVSEAQFLLLHRMLTDAGMEHYEVSNFAFPGRRARHNAAYWTGEPYLGVGPGAHSYDGLRVRRSFPWPVADYLAGRGYAVETLSDTDLRNELLMTRLRTLEGLPDALAPAGFETAARGFADRGLIVHTAGHWRIPPEKFLLSDVVISGLFM